LRRPAPHDRRMRMNDGMKLLLGLVIVSALLFAFG
jgi:hypothetical protein